MIEGNNTDDLKICLRILAPCSVMMRPTGLRDWSADLMINTHAEANALITVLDGLKFPIEWLIPD